MAVSPRILELVCLDNFGSAPCGRPDVPDESGIKIQTDAPDLMKSNQPETNWSQRMIYVVFPNGLCLHFDSDKLVRIFYIEESPSRDERAIKYFLREASRFCDDIALKSLDPTAVLTCFPEWHRQAVSIEESNLLNQAEKITTNLVGSTSSEVQDIVEFLKSDDWTD